MITDFGTDVTMNCTSDSASYQWSKLMSGFYHNLQNSSKYSISGKNLTIHNADLNDNGFYQCALIRSDGSLRGTENPIELVIKGLSKN